MDPLRQVERMSDDTKAQWAAKKGRQRGQFIKGPIPLPWLSAACLLPGKALHVAVAIWYRQGIDHGRPTELTRALLERFAVERTTAYRALRRMEHAGLVKVDRHRGRAPVSPSC